MNKLKVEVWSDIVCPFCYIGKRHYELALSQFAMADEFELEFKSFQLDPHFQYPTDEKYDLKKGLAEKYNKTEVEIEIMQQHIMETAKAVGLHFDFENSYRFNTQNAHRILHKAKDKGLSTEMADAFFSSYLEQCKNLAKTEMLKEVAINNGLSSEEVDQALEDDSFAYRVQQDMQEASQLGISAVPFFVFNRKYGISGAQPVEVFLKTMQQAHQDWKRSISPNIEIIGQNENTCDVDGNCQ